MNRNRFRGRRGGGGDGDYGAGHSGHGGGRGRGGGRPPGLSGREIGMYYRNLGMKKRDEEQRTGGIRLNPSVDIPPGVLSQVHKFLEAFEQQNQDEQVCHEFREHFHNLLHVSFEEFLEKAKENFDSKPNPNEEHSERLKLELERKNENEEYLKKLKMRQKLPTMQQSENILKSIRENQVVLVVGSTGCGKTTQIPQLILDEMIAANKGNTCRIVCTQPRRISAISVAERVAYERHESLGSSVGYQIRLESRMPRDNGSILYCTTGILLQKMQTDPLMSELTTIILDEIHERSVETDLLMGLLKIILPYRPDLKVILMSATVSEETFCEYFNNCHTLYIHGTLFPVEVLYLEDILQETGYTNFQNDCLASGKPQRGHNPRRKHEKQVSEKNFQYTHMIDSYVSAMKDKYDRQVIDTLRRYSDSEGCANLNFLEFLIFYICEHKPPGAILVFLPGYERISKLNDQLQRPSNPRHQHLAEKIQIYPLHSMMPTVNQRNVFEPAAPGMRKVILSTILAETSVTIDDVVYVINTGRTKVNDYDIEQNIQTLQEDWVSVANSKQRKGRAGRVQPGVCYNLFTRVRERSMSEIPVPEILRTKLESIILNLKLLHIKEPYDFLKTLINVPDIRAINHGLKLLKCIDALDNECNLTPLGLHLARLPIDPQMGKMILMAALFRCLDPITSAAAGISFKSPFYTPLGLEKKVDNIKRDLAQNTKSDHLLIHNVIKSYRTACDQGRDMNFCYNNFLSKSTVSQIENMKKQFAEILRNSSFLEFADCCARISNTNSDNVPLLRAIIASGLYPNLAFLRKVKRVGRHVHAIHSMSTPVDRKVNFHPSSVNSGEGSFDANYFVYFQKQKTSKVYLLDATMVFPMALLIFGDGVKQGELSPHEPYISVADIYFFKCDRESSNVILKLRQLLGVLLRKKAMHPSPIEPNSSDEQLIRAIHLLLSLDDMGEHVDQYPTDEEDDDDYTEDY
ncbi:ATP-dependent DNA/RNA helicase DHX36-like [Musca domestica]|uniref:ATP-dependent DNA/RNA helicase DHX36-like n=1 Tax=Musca domestica TaxID=7370 RepID=A0ABM3VNF1_MUSDO|nr:ATP-dependent DNA/RNA helicase DHX36-like [Musca domestica]